MNDDVQWTVHLKRVEAMVRVGIHSHEEAPQRIWVDVTLKGRYSARPTHISECINYDFVYDVITNEWPKRSQVFLLEHLASDLLDAIFTKDPKVEYAKVFVMKPDIFTHAEYVGVEIERGR